MVAVARVPVERLNELLRLGRARAERLEPKLAAVVRPVLDRAGREAARRFRELATDHLTASAADIPPDAHYRQAENLARSCATCEYYAAGWCNMWDTGVEAAYTCDEWEPIALTAAAPDLRESSTMVAVFPRDVEADALTRPDGTESTEILHVTLAYLGDCTEAQASAVASRLVPVAADFPPLAGVVGGIGAFQGGEKHPAIYLPDVPGLADLRHAVCEVIDATDGVEYAREHGWTPHVTVDYRDQPEPPDSEVLGSPLHFDDVRVVRGNVTVASLPFTGSPAALAAAADPTAQPPAWTAPAADELVDAAALVAALRTKTDPVRLALIRAQMTPALEAAGLSFDVTNPLAGLVLAQSASQITEIAATTQLNVMRIIKHSYEQGLSIPDTATAIQQGMAEASVARATLIARTELVGVVNGASLAATQTVEDATGVGYNKTWLTAPGAPYPRHELYEGLDGQTAPLDGYFTVGEAEMQFPGDPAGPVEEVANCRCAMVYEENGEQVEVGAEEEGGDLAVGQ